MTAPALPRIGIDLGGTKIEALALDEQSAALAGPIRIATPRNDYDGTIRAIASLVEALTSHLPRTATTARTAPEPGAATIGVGIPGSIVRATGLVQNANSIWLNGRPLLRDLIARLGDRVRIANDANCFALSEATDGAGAGMKNVFGAIVGTGCGGGLVVGGGLIDGPLGIGGEWGHNALPWAQADETPGPECWCGRTGCMETWVSGPGLERQFRANAGRAANVTEIIELAAEGDSAAQDVLARHTDRLGRGLAHVVNIFDPDVIVLGGGLSNLAHLYRALPDAICRHVFAEAPRIDVRPPKWGDSGGVRGAAWLWNNRLLDQ